MGEKGTDSLKVTRRVASLRGGPGAKEKKGHWHFDVTPRPGIVWGAWQTALQAITRELKTDPISPCSRWSETPGVGCKPRGKGGLGRVPTWRTELGACRRGTGVFQGLPGSLHSGSHRTTLPRLSLPHPSQIECSPVFLKPGFQLPEMLASKSMGMMPGEFAELPW